MRRPRRRQSPSRPAERPSCGSRPQRIRRGTRRAALVGDQIAPLVERRDGGIGRVVRLRADGKGHAVDRQLRLRARLGVLQADARQRLAAEIGRHNGREADFDVFPLPQRLGEPFFACPGTPDSARSRPARRSRRAAAPPAGRCCRRRPAPRCAPLKNAPSQTAQKDTPLPMRASSPGRCRRRCRAPAAMMTASAS